MSKQSNFEYDNKKEILISNLTTRGMIIQLELLEETPNLAILEQVYHVIDEPVSMDEKNQYRIKVKGMEDYLYLTKLSEDGLSTDCIYTVYKINKVIESKDNLGYEDFIIEIQMLNENLEEFGIEQVLKGLCRAFHCDLKDLYTVLKLNMPLFSKKMSKTSMVTLTVKSPEHQEKYISKESYRVYKTILLMFEELINGEIYPTLENLDKLTPILNKYFPYEKHKTQKEFKEREYAPYIKIKENQVFNFNKIPSPFIFNSEYKKCGFVTKDDNTNDKND